MSDESKKHLTDALGGQPIPPPSAAERVERERVYNLVRGVLTCYNSLIARETDEARRAELEAEQKIYTDEFRRHAAMTAAERRVVLAEYPELLARLQAELDG
ncbi:hypothetical protein [Kribbella sp. NPDC048915]|uniref:hypothetical protein n=1 Tax=Kribbella sp. NPDC048915 TaxID=3155148 RepID=UPI00340A51CE